MWSCNVVLWPDADGFLWLAVMVVMVLLHGRWLAVVDVFQHFLQKYLTMRSKAIEDYTRRHSFRNCGHNEMPVTYSALSASRKLSDNRLIIGQQYVVHQWANCKAATLASLAPHSASAPSQLAQNLVPATPTTAGHSYDSRWTSTQSSGWNKSRPQSRITEATGCLQCRISTVMCSSSNSPPLLC